MADFTSISVAVATVKNTLEIIKTAKDSDQLLEKSEFKMKIVELIDALTNAKNDLLGFQELIQEKDKRIGKLEDLFRFKSKLIRKKELYFEIDENGDPKDDPYCPRCWESDQKAIHLLQRDNEGDRFKCANCNNFFGKAKTTHFSGGSY